MTTPKYSLMAESIPYSPHLGWLVGCCAALILQQTYYWCRKNEEKKINLRDGFYWTYLTYKDWSTVLKGFEERTIRRNITLLVDKNLLVVGRYNKKGYDKTNWYRVNLPALNDLLEKNPLPTGQIGQSVWSNCPEHEANLTAPIPETKTETNQETNLAQAAPSLTESIQLANQPPEGENMAKGPSMTNELLAHMKNKGQPVAKPNTAHSLELVFKQVAPKHNEMSCIPSFTMKDKGQLGKLAAKWGSRADAVMDAICRSWIPFAKGVASELGFSKYPLVPHLPFITKYVEHARVFAIDNPVQVVAELEPATQAGIPVMESNQAVTAPKKKLVILKKGSAQPPATLQPPALAPVKSEEDKELTLEDLLAFKPAKKT